MPRDKEMTAPVQPEILSYCFGDFLQRRHVASSSKIILIFFATRLNESEWVSCRSGVNSMAQDNLKVLVGAGAGACFLLIVVILGEKHCPPIWEKSSSRPKWEMSPVWC
jgi:hypothetical protein